MIPLEEARTFVLDGCSRLPARHVALDDALGCVSAGSVVATEPVPPFANSSMDGYALRAVDTRGAPVRLEVVGTVMAGSWAGVPVGEGQAIRIMTGAPVPDGADAVCMLEETQVEGDGRVVLVELEMEAGANVRRPGEDVAVGDQLVAAGTPLTAAYLGVLANQGVVHAFVIPRPRVGVLSTGDELTPGDSPLAPGKIRDANRHTLLGLIRGEGWEAVDLGIVGDDEVALRDVFEGAHDRCDAIVTSGGVSVGDLDVVRMVLEKLGGNAMRWMQIAIKPAKPFAFGTLAHSGTPVFGLPGNPVSAMVSFELLVRPAIRKMAGHHVLRRPTVPAITEEDLVRRPDGKLHFLRGTVHLDRDGTWRIRTRLGQGSHQLHAMAASNALALLPDGSGVAAGESVDVLLIDPARVSGADDDERWSS